MNLPSPQDFLTGLASASTGVLPRIDPKKMSPEERAHADAVEFGNEMRSLVIQYCAQTSTESLSAVNFLGLANRLGCPLPMVTEVVSSFDEEALWAEVLKIRIKRALAARVFTDNKWERLESLAVNKLTDLMERNMIRDTGELIAVASAARRSQTGPATPPGGTTVNVNIGDPMMNGTGLPPVGSKIAIDLSPRIASSLQERAASVSGKQNRVIDGEMLTAKELRAMVSPSANAADGQLNQNPDGFRDEDIT